jgi:hypothetical protein
MPARGRLYRLRGHPRVCLVPPPSLSELIYVRGLVRAVCDDPDVEVVLIIARDTIPAFRRLFGDLPALRFRCAEERPVPALRAAGFTIVELPSAREACPYAAVGLAATWARSGQGVRREPGAEGALHQRVVAAVGPRYVLVHDSPRRAVLPRLLPKAPPAVRVSQTDCALDWLGVMENASEIHGMDSWALLLADMLALPPRKFCHAYASGTRATGPRAVLPYSNDVVCIWG